MGPITDPTVAPQTTMPMADARRAGATMSADAYRDSWLELLPKPMSSVPASSSQNELPITAAAAISAPTTPIA